MRGWLMTETALPMSWQSEATITSGRRSGLLGPGGRLQRVHQLVDGELVGDLLQRGQHGQHALGHPRLLLHRLDHDRPAIRAAVDSSMRVKVTAQSSHRTRLTRPACPGRRPPRWPGPRPPGRPVAAAGRPARKPSVRAHGPQQLPQFGRGWEVLVLGGHRHLGHPLAGGQRRDDLFHQGFWGRGAGRDPDGAAPGRRAARPPR